MSFAVGFHQRYALGAQGADHPRELILMQKNRVGGGPHGTSRWPVSPPPRPSRRPRQAVDASDRGGFPADAAVGRTLPGEGWPRWAPAGMRLRGMTSWGRVGRAGRGDQTPVQYGMRRPAQCWSEVDRCGLRSTRRVISLGAKTRNGGPQKPVPRLV
ncbi:hypothetical protein GCM10023097_74160 [Streptomyces collinus]